MIASKYSGFRQLAFLFGPPPKGIWLRVGNCSTATIAAVFRSSVDAIAEFAVAEEESLLVLPDLDP